VTRTDEIREAALKNLRQYHVLMVDGHFDFGNGFHGRVYLNPHQLFRYPSTIWRFAQDLLDVVPASVLERAEAVAGPVTGGALLAHTMAGLLDSRRDLSRPPTLFAPIGVDPAGGYRLSRFYADQLRGRAVLLVDDVRNTGQTFSRCAELIRAAGGTVLATAEIYDRLEAVSGAGVPNVSLAEYKAPPNVAVSECPMCRDGVPITSF
jgi:orotate phosphoribosyltransferase